MSKSPPTERSPSIKTSSLNVATPTKVDKPLTNKSLMLKPSPLKS